MNLNLSEPEHLLIILRVYYTRYRARCVRTGELKGGCNTRGVVYRLRGRTCATFVPGDVPTGHEAAYLREVLGLTQTPVGTISEEVPWWCDGPEPVLGLSRQTWGRLATGPAIRPEEDEKDTWRVGPGTYFLHGTIYTVSHDGVVTKSTPEETRERLRPSMDIVRDELERLCSAEKWGEARIVASWLPEDDIDGAGRAYILDRRRANEPDGWMIAGLDMDLVILPKLTGSPKQIAWAYDLRAQALNLIDIAIADDPDGLGLFPRLGEEILGDTEKARQRRLIIERLAVGVPEVWPWFVVAMVKCLSMRTSARWWIEHREELSNLRGLTAALVGPYYGYGYRRWGKASFIRVVRDLAIHYASPIVGAHT